MKGQALIKRFQAKNRELQESAEFERFLDSHERAWMDYETSRQGRGMRGIQRPGAVVRPAITRDDLGGPNVVNQLRKSRQPEAELDGLIKAAERNGDNDRAARLKDFQTEFQFQKQEIAAGIRQGYEDLNSTYARAGIGELGQQQKERDQEQYMTPHATQMAQAGAQQGGADVKVQKFADGSVGGSISGTATGTLAGGDGRLEDGYSNIRRSMNDRIRSLSDSDPNSGQLRNLLQFKQQLERLDGDRNIEAPQKKARKEEILKKVEQALLGSKKPDEPNANQRSMGAAGDLRSAAQQARPSAPAPAQRNFQAMDQVRQMASDITQDKQADPDAELDKTIAGIEKVRSAPQDKRAEVAKKELSKPQPSSGMSDDPDEILRQLAAVDPKAAAAAAQFMQQDQERAQQEKPKPFERTLSDADREKRETDRIQGASWKREVGDDEQAIKDRLKEMGLKHSSGGQWRDARGNLGATLRNGKVTYEPGFGDREDEPKRRGIGDPAPEREPGEVDAPDQGVSQTQRAMDRNMANLAGGEKADAPKRKLNRPDDQVRNDLRDIATQKGYKLNSIGKDGNTYTDPSGEYDPIFQMGDELRGIKNGKEEVVAKLGDAMDARDVVSSPDAASREDKPTGTPRSFFPTEEEERQAEAERLKLTHVGGGIYEGANGTKYRWENGRFVQVKGQEKGSKRKGKGKGTAKSKSKTLSAPKPGLSRASKSKGFKVPTAGKSAMVRRVKEDKRKTTNPFNRRTTKDPNIEAHLEMASKRVSAIRKKMKDLIDQLKKEKNPIIKERLQKQLAGLDSQLATAYVTLERLKGLSGATTAVGGESFDQIRSLFRDSEQLSMEASEFHGKEPAVFTAAKAFKSKNGSSSLEDLFKDSNKSMKDRFGKNQKPGQKLEPIPEVTADEERFTDPGDWMKYRDQALTDEAIEEWENFDEGDADGSIDAEGGDVGTFSSDERSERKPVSNSVFDIGVEKTPEEIKAEAEAREAAERDREAFDAAYYDPYKDETPGQRKRRVKAEREITREKEALLATYMPMIDRATYVMSRVKNPNSEKGKSQKGKAQALFAYAFGILNGEMDRIQKKIDSRNLFRKPVERDPYDSKHEQEINDDFRKLNPGGSAEDFVKQFEDNLQSLRGQKPLSEQEKIMAKMIVLHHAHESVTGERRLSKYGKEFVEASANFNHDTKYVRNEARALYRNLLYSTREGLSQFHPTLVPDGGQNNVLAGLRLGFLQDSNPWALRVKQEEQFNNLRHLDGGKITPLETTIDGPMGEPIQITSKGLGGSTDADGMLSIGSLGHETHKASPAYAEKTATDMLNDLNAIPDEDLHKNPYGLNAGEMNFTPETDEERKRVIERSKTAHRIDPEFQTTSQMMMGRDKIKTPRGNKIRGGKAERIKRRARAQAVQKVFNKPRDINLKTENWSWEIVNQGGYDFPVQFLVAEAAAVFFQESLWGKELRRAADTLEKLESSNAYLAENQMATGCAQLLSQQIEEMLTQEGISSFEGYEEDLAEMTPEERVRYRLAEREFHEKNEFYYPIEKFVILNEYIDNTTAYLDVPVSPINHQVLRENKELESAEFYKALLEVSQEVVEHCGCEEKDKLQVDKGPQRVKEIPIQAAPAPSRKPQTATEILASMKPPRKKLSLRRNK